MSRRLLNRRQALGASVSAATGIALAQSAGPPKLIGEPPGRIPPVAELVNAAEFESVAKRELDSITFAQVVGTERAALDRITLRPRLMVDTTKMDLSSTLFGEPMFMPIIAGPMARLKRFHPEGELAMARGVSAAKSLMIVSADSSYPVEQIAAQAKCPLWYQVWLEPDMDELHRRVEKAAAAGCKALCVTIGNSPESSGRPAVAGINWNAIERFRKAASMPVVLKGVMSPEEAAKAVSEGVQGLVISSYSARPTPGVASSIEVLAAIADAVAGKAIILIDGSFRLGSDILKALALGAQAVLLGRPTVWGLAAYGEQGVQSVIEIIQSSFARDMAMCGKINLKALDRTAVRMHTR